MNGKIKILKNGPYLVTGNIKLSEKVIVHENHQNNWMEIQELPQAANYTLCRCGRSKKAPFCDGTHENVQFNGTETASKANYSQRIQEVTQGPELTLQDDGRCAFLRFCHRAKGDVWNLTEQSDNPESKAEAIKAASDCPAGRLTAVEKDGKAIEPEYEQSIEIIQDFPQKVSGPIFVKGGILIESSDGVQYETRNRVTLCRCGQSKNKPFCDATHVIIKYSDKK